MTIDSVGRIRWATPPSQSSSGPFAVQVTVSDPYGGTASQSYSLTVQGDTQAPHVFLQLTPNPAALGTAVTFLVRASDNVGVAGVTLTVGSSNVALDAQGV